MNYLISPAMIRISFLLFHFKAYHCVPSAYQDVPSAYRGVPKFFYHQFQPKHFPKNAQPVPKGNSLKGPGCSPARRRTAANCHFPKYRKMVPICTALQGFIGFFWGFFRFFVL